MTTPTNREELIRMRTQTMVRVMKDADYQECEEIARATLEAEEAAGVVCVPAWPTMHMQAACCDLLDDDDEWKPETHQTDFWKRMIGASPFGKGE